MFIKLEAGWHVACHVNVLLYFMTDCTVQAYHVHVFDGSGLSITFPMVDGY